MLLRVVLELTFVPIVFMTVFAVMTLVDRTTPWEVGSWRGPGPSEDYWKIAALLACGWTLLVLGWRGARTAFKCGIVLWHFGLAAGSLASLRESSDFVVRGDALGFQISVGLLAPIFSLTALVCALVWITGDSRKSAAARSVSPLQRRNRLAAAVAVLGLLASGLAFAYDFEELGTITCIATTLACHEVMRPVNPSAELHKALVGEGSALE